jgi:hypothetical protein
LRNFVAIGLLVEEVKYEYLIEVGEVDVVNGAVVERFMILLVFVAIALFLTIVLLGLFLRVFASTFDSLE